MSAPLHRVSGPVSRPDDPGISPTTQAERRLGGVDLAVLWGNMGVSLLVVTTGALLVPALSLPAAIGAIAIGGLLGAALLAASCWLGATTGLPGMALLRRAVGDRGSALPTVLNVAQNLGWGTFETIVIAEAARQVLGVDVRWPFVLAAGAAATIMAVAGPTSVVRRLLRRIATPLVAVSMAYLLVRFAGDANFGAAAAGGLSFAYAVDLVIANAASWLPLAPDYTRFARSPRAASLGGAAGYAVASSVTLAVGALAGTADASGAVAAILALPLGVLVASILVADEAEKSFANVYSTSVSLQNLAPRLPQRAAAVAVGVVVTVAALVLSIDRYLDFLFLIGALFVPLYGAVIADRLRPPRPAATAIAWIVGAIVYQWLAPTAIGPLNDAESWLAGLLHVPLPLGGGDFGGSLPAFAAAFATRLALGLRRPVAAGAPVSP